MDREIKAIRSKLNNPRKIAFLTGAGISAESGIPTFRGLGGLWKNYRAEDLATPVAFQKDPNLVWEWYEMRREICQKALPNAGHLSIAKADELNSQIHVFTQNVDGLHKKAGSQNITELHGNIFSARCVDSSCNTILEDIPFSLKKIPPDCPECGKILRPHILWFGETYDTDILETSLSYMRTADMIFIIGTSGQVTVPVYLAEEAIKSGAFSVEINPQESTLSPYVDISLRGKSGEILPLIFPLDT